MGHSENRGGRRLTLPLQPRAKLIGLSILIAGFASLITSAQLDPITAQGERVIDGDTIRVRMEGKSYTVRLMGVDTPETKHPTKATSSWTETTSTPGSSARATLMLTAAFPSPSDRSLSALKNKRSGEESAYGTPAEIAGLRTRPSTATCACGPLTFRTKPLRSIDRELPGETQR